jgi:hypothetical protein
MGQVETCHHVARSAQCRPVSLSERTCRAILAPVATGGPLRSAHTGRDRGWFGRCGLNGNTVASF